jgi:hypothetical protein
MPRQKSLLTVIRDLVQQEVRAAIQSLLGSISTRPARRTGAAGADVGGPGRPRGIEEQGGLTRARAFRCATSEPHCPRGARCGGPAARGPCDFGSAPPEPCGTHHGASRRWSPPEPLALPASQ